jgi:hypothetical protein
VQIRRASRSEIEQGKDLFRRFTGHEAEAIGKVEVREVSAVGVVIGTLDAFEYTTVRDGVTERYRHRFAKRDRPLFVVSPDGEQMWVIGGDYDFTERGIVDGSDDKTRRELGIR